MYGVCTLFHSVGGDRTSILSQLGRRISTEDVRVFLQVTSMFGTEKRKDTDKKTFCGILNSEVFNSSSCY